MLLSVLGQSAGYYSLPNFGSSSGFIITVACIGLAQACFAHFSPQAWPLLLYKHLGKIGGAQLTARWAAPRPQDVGRSRGFGLFGSACRLSAILPLLVLPLTAR